MRKEDSPQMVTIIIPSYNHSQYIEQAICSALNQTYKNLEVIVVDDGSQDESPELLVQLTKKYDFKLLIQERNKGQSAAINRALKEAKGEFISLLPSDDWYEPEKTALQVEKFKELPESYGVVYGRGKRFFEDTGETIDVAPPTNRGDVYLKLLKGPNFVYPASPLFKAECFKRVPFDERWIAEGEAIYMKIARHYKFDFVENFVVTMRDHSYNTGKLTDRMYEQTVGYFEDYFESESLTPEARDLRPICLGRIHRVKGFDKITKGTDIKGGRTALLKAISENPVYEYDKKLRFLLLISRLPNWQIRLIMLATHKVIGKRNQRKLSGR